MKNFFTPPETLDPATVMAAFGNPNRWLMVTLMAKGEPVTVNGMMTLTGRGYRAVHKDLTILWASGAVAVRFGEDKRVGLYHIAEKYLLRPGVADYGFCAVRFGNAAKLTERIPKD